MASFAPLVRALLACLLVFVCSAAWSKPPAEAAGEVQNKVGGRADQADGASAKGKSVAGSTLSTESITHPQQTNREPQAQSDYRDKSSANEERIADWTARLGWTTFVLAAIAIAQALLFGKQLGWMRQSNEAAKKQARAYISTTGISDPHRNLGFTACEATVTFRNTGQTPARNARGIVHVDIVSLAHTGGMYLRADVPENGSVFKLRAGMSHNIFGGPVCDFSAEETESALAGRTRYAVYGAIEYTDIFDVRRRTEFLNYWNGANAEYWGSAYHSHAD